MRPQRNSATQQAATQRNPRPGPRGEKMPLKAYSKLIPLRTFFAFMPQMA
jgi:hypothetical protein